MTFAARVSLSIIPIAVSAACGDSNSSRPRTTPPAPQVSDPVPTAFRSTLEAHNRARSQVGAPALRWSRSTAALAQSWADTLTSVLSCGSIGHNPDLGGFGENIAASQPGMPLEDYVSLWLSEGVGFDVANGQCAAGRTCGHYTQVIAQRTTHLGCGTASCNGFQVLVCDYYPAGNLVASFGNEPSKR